MATKEFRIMVDFLPTIMGGVDIKLLSLHTEHNRSDPARLAWMGAVEMWKSFTP